MSDIQLQNGNLNGGLSNREKSLQGSIASQNTLQASVTSSGDLQASLMVLESLRASMTTQNNLKASIKSAAVLNGIVVKPATMLAYEVDMNLSLDSTNPVQNRIITETLVELYSAFNNKADKEDIPTIPTNVSAFFNDVGYLTEHQDLSAYAKLSDIPTIPTNVSAFFNDSGYLTEHQDLSEYAKTIDLPTKVSELINDAGYLTEHQSLENYFTKSEMIIELGKKQDSLTSYVESVNGYSGLITLTATDVHALPDTTVIPVVPTLISAFTNDADYATRTYVTEVAAGKCNAYTFDTVEELDNWIKVNENVVDLNNGDVFYIRAVGVPDYWWDKETQTKQILETTKVDLTDYAKTSSIPTNVSQLANDSNFITVAEVDTKLGTKQDKLTSYVSSVNGKSGSVTLSCSDIGAMPADTPIPTVPTKVSAFTNDAGYLTQHQDLSAYAKKSDIPTVPTALSQLSNDKKFVSEDEVKALIKSIVLNGYLGGKQLRFVNDSGLDGYVTFKKG